MKWNVGGVEKGDRHGATKKGDPRGSPYKNWRRPTFPQTSAVSSAMLGLTSLFGMGRGEHQLHSHQK